MAKAKLPDGLRKVLSKPSKNPSQAEFLAEVVTQAGGPRQLGAIMWNEFNRDGASPMFKARFMDMILRAMREEDRKAPPKDLGEVTDSELEDIVNEIIKRREESERAKETGEDLRPAD